MTLTASSFRLATRSHLQGIPRSNSGSCSIHFQIGCAVSPTICSSLVPWFAQHQRSGWFCSLTCKVLLDRTAAHAASTSRLLTRSHLQGIPRSYRRSCSTNFRTGYVVPPEGIPRLFVSWLTQHTLSNGLRGLTHKVFLDRTAAHAS